MRAAIITWVLTGLWILGLMAPVTAQAKPSQPSVTLKMEGWVVSKAQLTDMNALLSQFEKSHRRIRVAFTPIEGDFESILESQFVGHNAPDVIEVDAGWVRDFIQAHALQRLDTYAYGDRTYQPNDFHYQVVGSLSRSGRVYAYPFAYSTMGLWYNRALFKQHRIKHPPTDWQSFARVACQLTNKKKHIFGAVLSTNPNHWFPFLKSFGGHVLNEKGTAPAINSKRTVAAVKWYAGMLRKGCATVPTSGSSDIDEFGAGHAAMMFELSDVGKILHTSYHHLTWGTAHLPSGPKGASDIDYVNGLGMNVRSKQKADAWKLISFLTNKSSLQTFDTEAGYLPPRRSLSAGKNLGVFARGAVNASPWVWPPGLVANAFPEIDNDLSRVAAHKMSYAAAVSDMATWLKRYL